MEETPTKETTVLTVPGKACVHVASRAREEGDLASHVEWLQTAVDLLREGEHDTELLRCDKRTDRYKEL